MNIEGFYAKASQLDLEASKSERDIVLQKEQPSIVLKQDAWGDWMAVVPPLTTALQVFALARTEVGGMTEITDNNINLLVDGRSPAGIERDYLNILDPAGRETNRRGEPCTRIEFVVTSPSIPTPRKRLESGSYLVKFNADELMDRMDALARPARPEKLLTLDAA